MFRLANDRDRAGVQALPRACNIVGQHIDRDGSVDGARTSIALCGGILVEKRTVVGAESVAIDDQHIWLSVLYECADGNGTPVAAESSGGNVDRHDIRKRIGSAIVEIDGAD